MKALSGIGTLVVTLFLCVMASQVAAEVVYDGALYEPFIAYDHIGETDNVEMVRGYYGYFDIHNGKLKQVDDAKPGTLVSMPFVVCNPEVDWTTLEWEGDFPGRATATCT